MALELLPAEVRERVVLADAPLVEGAVAAAVESSLGKSLVEVKAAAEAARNLSKVS
jgi:dihydroxyacetone kinase DhaKLM complex PTS-EIIA-like component DhaM